MKKFFALLLTLVMVFSMSTVAFAASWDGDAWTGENTGNVNVTVDNAAGSNVYFVTVEWETLQFTYNMSNVKWDPASHTYKAAENATGAAWDKTAIAEAITVTNHSNDAVSINASFGGQSTATNFGVTATVAATGDTTLESADIVALGDTSMAEFVTYTVSIAGDPNNSYNPSAPVVGTITVAISPLNP